MKPIRILKAVFVVKIITLVALLLVVTALSLFVMLFPKSKIESIINVRAENLLQRRIDIGSISYSFRGVKLNDVRIMEPDNDNSFVSAKSIEVIFALAPILNRRLELQDLYIDNLTLFLDYRDGEYNLDRMVRSIQQSVQTGDSEGFEATIPRFHLNEALINVNNTAEDLAPLRGEYGISADIVYNENATVNIDNLSVRMPTTRGTVTGDLLLTLSDSSFEITGEADIEEVDIRWTYPFNEGEPADLPYYLINGHVNDLKITPEYTEGTVRDTTCTLINGVFVKVDSGYCRVIYEPNTLILKDVDGSANRSTFILRDLNILFDTHVDFDAQLHDVNIIDVQSMIPPIEDMPLGGNIKGTLSYDGTLYNGTVELTDAAYNPYISSVTGRITIQNNTFSKEDLHVKILGENATISAASLSRSFDNFAFNAHFPTLTLGDRPEEKLKMPGKDITIEVNGIITADTLVYEKLTLNDVYCAYTLNRSGITFPRFKTGFHKGDIAGSAEIPSSNGNPRIHTVLNISQVQVQRLAPYIENIEDRFYGLVSGNADITFVPGEDAVKSMDGSLDVRIENGKLLNTGIQDSLGLILQPLQYKLSDLEFQEIYGNVTMDNGVYNINSLMFNSPNIRMSVNGSINRSNIANLDITLLFNSAFIQDIPNFAYPQFQRYREGEWYVLPFRVNNKNIMENPQAELVN